MNHILHTALVSLTSGTFGGHTNHNSISCKFKEDYRLTADKMRLKKSNRETSRTPNEIQKNFFQTKNK